MMCAAFTLDMLAIGIGSVVSKLISSGSRARLELLAPILTEQSNRIRAALPAVAHELGAAFERVLNRLQFLRRRSTLPIEAEIGSVSRIGNQRHDVVKECAPRVHRAVDIEQMRIVHARDHHRIDLHQHLARGEHLEFEHLPFMQNSHGLEPGVAAVLVKYPRIDFRSDFRIDHVDRHGHVIDVHVDDLIDMIRQSEAVCRKAELEIGEQFRHRVKRRLRVSPVVKSISRSCYPEHGKLRHLLGDGKELRAPCSGVSRSETTPGRLSLAQSYFRLQ